MNNFLILNLVRYFVLNIDYKILLSSTESSLKKVIDSNEN